MRISHYLAWPALIVGATLLFYLVLLATGTSASEAAASGFFVERLPETAGWQPLLPSRLAQVDWPVVFSEAGNMAAMAAVGVTALLLNAAGLELALKRDFDLNRELRVAGLANLLTGLAGGAGGYHVVSMTALSNKVGGRSRLVGLIVGGVGLLTLLFGGGLLYVIPRFVLGGTVMFLGLSFLYEWLVQAWSRLPRGDYAVMLLILVIIAATGFLQGVAAGVFASAVLFIVNYSRVSVVREVLTGANFRSNVERPARHVQMLRQRGEQLVIFRLQGYIFFGTASRLLARLYQRLLMADKPPLAYLVLDFRRVTGLDSSAELSFTRMKQLAESRHFKLLLSGLVPTLARELGPELLAESGEETVRVFPDLDHAVEWCETQVLSEMGAEWPGEGQSLRQHLNEFFPPSIDEARLVAYLEGQALPANHTLVRQGDPPDHLYFVGSGRLSAWFETEDGDRIRLRTLEFGNLIGEIGMYLNEQRTASVVADVPSVVYRLTASALEDMKRDDPDLAAAFHEFVAKRLAERLADSNRIISALMD